VVVRKGKGRKDREVSTMDPLHFPLLTLLVKHQRRWTKAAQKTARMANQGPFCLLLCLRKCFAQTSNAHGVGLKPMSRSCRSRYQRGTVQVRRRCHCKTTIENRNALIFGTLGLCSKSKSKSHPVKSTHQTNKPPVGLSHPSGAKTSCLISTRCLRASYNGIVLRRTPRAEKRT